MCEIWRYDYTGYTVCNSMPCGQMVAAGCYIAVVVSLMCGTHAGRRMSNHGLGWGNGFMAWLVETFWAHADMVTWLTCFYGRTRTL